MIFYILTLFPEVFSSYLQSSILGKAIQAQKIKVELINIRDFAFNKHKSCDDAPYGGGPGMLLMPEPLSLALESVNAGARRVVYLSPSGKLFNQNMAKQLIKEESLVMICGHYEGIDQRIIDLYVSDEVSIGDYVLFSGEVAGMVLIDTLARLIEGVIRKESIEEESFSNGLLEYPQYTRPQNFRDREVPEILLSGHHAKIQAWRRQKSIEKTLINRPELFDKINLFEKK